MRHDFLGAQGIDLVGVHLAEATPVRQRIRRPTLGEWLCGAAVILIPLAFLYAF